MSASGGTKAVIAALAANAAIAAAKFVAWGLTGAASMLAEAIHSVADTSNQAVLLISGKAARRAATPEHPFGYGRDRYIGAFGVAIILFSMGGVFALYEAFHKFEEVSAGHPNAMLEGPWWWVPVVVLVFAIVAETLSFRTAIREAKPVKGDKTWWEFIRGSKNPELPVILLEDLAALVGLVFALVGVGMTIVTRNGYWDVAGTTAIGLLLVAVSVVLVIETKSFLTGEAASPEAVAAMTDALEATPGVESIIHLKTLHLGPEEVLLAAKIAIPASSSMAQVAEIINDAEDRIRAAEPQVTALYLEPDIEAAVTAAQEVTP